MRAVPGVVTLVEAWAELLLAAVAIRSPWRQGYLRASPLRGARAGEGAVRSTIRSLEVAASHHLKPMTCLERSAAGQRLLRRRGVPAELRLGVQCAEAGSLEAHAWVEIGGEPWDRLASQFAALEQGCQRTLAGVRLSSPWHLPVLDDGAEADLECVARLGRPPEEEAGKWQALPPHPGGGKGWVTDDGCSVAVESVSGSQDEIAALLRWVVPFASALQGGVILHASAVSKGDRAAAFVGESGAGKSTLADALSGSGWAKVSDDLLPCRVVQGAGAAAVGRDGTVVVLAGRRRLALQALFFVERVSPSAAPRALRLLPADTLQQLLRHGFGELADPRIWRHQFELYGALAERVASYRLEIPDDLTRLAETVACIQERTRA